MSDILEKQITNLLHERNFEKAFQLVMSSYKERLYWHIRHMVLSHDDTDDILQNVFIKIWKNLPKFEGRSQVFSWAYRIATNETLTFLEKKKRKYAISIDADEGVIANTLMADEYFDGDYAQAILLEAVQTLPEKQRQVFTMKYFEELRYNEISELLETSVGGLKASYHHAVKKIEQYAKWKVH